MLLNLETGTADLDRMRVLRGSEVTSLTATEARLLRHLAARRGAPATREELLVEVWEYHPKSRSQTVRTTINRLRAKIERDPKAPAHLQTVKGAGYRLALPQSRPGPPLVGRRADLEQLQRRLTQPGVVTVVGPPGVGKSRLARELARQLEPGAVQVEAASCDTAASLAGEVASTLGIAADDLVSIVYALADRVLILDNVEQLHDTVGEWFDDLFRAGPSTRVLATARVPLEGHPAVALGPLSANDAASLLQVHAELPSDAAHAIVAHLGGLPLAVEMAAACLAFVDPAGLAEQLQDPGELLDVRGGRDGSLAAALDRSWALLSPRDQRALRALAMFPGSRPTSPSDPRRSWRAR